MIRIFSKRHLPSLGSRFPLVAPIRIVSLFLSFFLLNPLLLRGEGVFDHSKWGHLLKQYVHHGLVDYKGLLQTKGELDDYLKQINSVSIEEFSEFSREERIAFWINLYNASVIHMILDEYPIESFDQIPASFEIRTIQAIGEFFSLSELRDQVLRKGFRDERILMALVSGRMDSPKLLPEAFQGNKLEEQLNLVARNFVEDETKNRIKPKEKKISLSPLFRNFASDFVLNFGSFNPPSRFSQTETAVISFVLHHLNNPEKRIFLDSSRYKIQYLPENPKLNQA